MKIGIVWAGSKVHVNDANRSCSLNQFGWLTGMPETSVYSLQKEISEKEQQALQEMGIVSLGHDFDDFADTAAVMDCLDLIISVDTSVVHLAGAMGKRVWVLVPFDPDWRWMLGMSKSPWYPTATLFRQEKPGDWCSVMEIIRGKINSMG